MTKGECLGTCHLPRKKRLSFNDRCLDNLLCRENTPCHYIPSIIRDIRAKFTLPKMLGQIVNHIRCSIYLIIASKIVHPTTSFDLCPFLNHNNIFLFAKELHETLLEDVSRFRAPSKDRIGRVRSINSWLRTYGPPAFQSELF